MGLLSVFSERGDSLSRVSIKGSIWIFYEDLISNRTSRTWLISIRHVALCLNPQCQKKVSDSRSSCPFCGGIEISKFDSYSKSELLKEELSMENFEKVIKNSQPYIERTIVPKGAKISFRSLLIVRFQYLARKILRKRWPRPLFIGYLPKPDHLNASALEF